MSFNLSKMQKQAEFYTSEDMKDLAEDKKDKEETETKEDDKDFGFGIADHLEKIDDLLALLQEDINSAPKPKLNHKSLSHMLSKMLSPGLMGNLPFADISLLPKDMEDLDDARGQITVMTGHQENGGPMEVKKKVIKLQPKDKNDDENIEDNDAEEDTCDTCGTCDLAKAASIVKNIARKARFAMDSMVKANVKIASKNVNSYVRSLKEAYKYAKDIANNGENEQYVFAMLSKLNPARYSGQIDNDTLYIISNVINDLSLCPDYSSESYNLIADRIKIAYLNLLDDDSMVKSAYYEVKEENSPSKGFNMCPKNKTVKGEYLPVAMDFCQRECIEGKPENNGEVSCKYSYWLENVADNHTKAMNKLDIQRSAVNDDMQLRLPDGQRSFPDRGYMRNTEKRMEDAKIRGREWDSIKKSQKVDSKSPGKILNYESLMDEVLDAKDIHRVGPTDDDENNTEKKLRANATNETVNKSTEQRLYNKGAEEKGKKYGNVEFNLLDQRDKHKLDPTKLMDELLEQKYPRTEEKRP